VQAQKLLGQWTFEPGKELKDLAGTLVILSSKRKQQSRRDNGAWHQLLAITTGYKGPDITEKTLVAWLYIDDLDIKLGAPIAYNKPLRTHLTLLSTRSDSLVVGCWK